MLSDYGKSNLIISYEDLKEITGYDSPSKVANCLSRQGIKYLLGKHSKPWTTLGALELAMGATFIHYGINPELNKDEEISFL